MGCVLVVDDDEALREIVAEAISDAGYDVEQAENGVEALDKMRQKAPCIVVLDLMMPVMDGWEVMAAMESDEALSRVPVCIVSAQDAVAPPKNAYFIKKPLTTAALLDQVVRHCGRAS